MSARKLSRLAGLVFVLAVIFGGVGAASVEGGHASAANSEAADMTTSLIIEWD